MPAPDPREYRIVFASHTVMGATFVVGSHHLARQCALRGHHVLHLSTPLTPAHLARIGRDEAVRVRFRTWRRGLRRDDSGVAEAVGMTLLPWSVAGPIFRLTGLNPMLWTIPGLRRLLDRAGMAAPDLLICDQPVFAGIGSIVAPRAMVYRATDDYPAMRGGGAVVAAERALLARADGIVATARPLLDRLRAAAPDRPSLLLENGVDHSHFSTPAGMPAEYRSVPRPRAVYVGALDERFDAEAVRRLARGAPDLNVVLVGPARRQTQLSLADIPNLHVLGPRPYADLPPYLQHADIALLPLGDHAANDSRSPMKLYEYQAAGLPVLARATAELTRRHDPHVHFYRARADIVPAATALLSRAASLDPARRREISGHVIQFDWSRRAEDLLRFVSGLPRGTGRPGEVTPDVS